MTLILIGYRGTGKTTVARKLASRLDRSWLDTDALVEAAAGKSIADIFAEEGEAAFRDRETAVLRQFGSAEPQVIALGGGAVLRQENRQLLKAAGTVVWLKATPRAILARLAADPATPTQRPNLTANGGLQEIIDVLAARDAFYRECAEIEVDTENKDADAVATEILARINLTPEAS